MFERQCRLARAAKYFKGGGGGSIDIPSLNSTLNQAIGGFSGVDRLYRNFAGKEDYLNWQNPILKQLSEYGQSAAQQFGNVPGQLLSRAEQFRNSFGSLPGDTLRGADALRRQFQNVPAGIMRQFRDLPGQYLNVMQGQLPIAQTGQLTQDQSNQAIQDARAAAQARGDIYSNNASFAEALNRRRFADARQQQAIGNIQSLGQAALGTALQRDQGAEGLGIGLQNAVMGLRQGAQGMALGREQGAMGLQQGAMGMGQGIEQLLGYPSEQLTKGELGRVGAFQTMFGPVENLAGDWLKAQAGANVAGAGQDSSNKNATLGTIGTIIGGVATAY